MKRTLCQRLWLIARSLPLALGLAAAAGAQTTFNYTGSVQTYVLPAGASGVLMQAAGAGGGGGGADDNGPGSAGGPGAIATGVYLTAGGSSLTVYVGGGGNPGFTSNFGRNCTSSAGAGGQSGGVGGFAGGAGGQAGCPGWSGGGGGGGAASVVVGSGGPLLIAAGGGGGQGGSWNSTSVTSQNPAVIGVLPGSVGGAGASYGNSADGGGGGGGGGGCPGGAGGTTHGDNTGTTFGSPAIFGGSCAGAAIRGFLVLTTPGGVGGTGQPASDGVHNPGATAGGSGSVTLTPLYALTVTIFADTGAGGGTANDAVQNGTEPGLANVTVSASSGGSSIATAVTNASGVAVLLLPATAKGTTVTVAPVAPTGFIATGGNAGDTGGIYLRPAVSFPFTATQPYSGVRFGLVPPNSFAPNGAVTAQPGTTVVYAHSFTAGSGGQVTFSTSSASSPTLPGWTEVLYRDANCNGVIDAVDSVLSGSVAATAQQQICILVKEFVPPAAQTNAQNTVTVSASFAYSGSAAPAAVVQVDSDKTTVASAGTVQLTKLVQNLTQGSAYGAAGNAAPGNTLQYQLTLFNQGTTALSNVVVDDATPAFTSFVSAACPAPVTLPSNLTACTVSAQPAVGAQGGLAWTFAGTLAPGAQTAVTYQVRVAQ